jgi:transglutaminase-like putative cysteine protease
VTQSLQDMQRFLEPGVFIDSAHPAVVAFGREAVGASTDPLERVCRLYYAVRDNIRYDPYVDYGRPDSYRASTCIAEGRGFCIPKAALLAATARVAGIPARIGFADVRNHLATRRLIEQLGRDEFVYHGYAELFIDGRWVKATPTFNIGLCQRFGVKSLEFDGRHDAMLHPFDTQGRRHMEYLRDHGTFVDVPCERIIAAMRAAYPAVFASHGGRLAGDFAGEASADRAASARNDDTPVNAGRVAYTASPSSSRMSERT